MQRNIIIAISQETESFKTANSEDGRKLTTVSEEHGQESASASGHQKEACAEPPSSEAGGASSHAGADPPSENDNVSNMGLCFPTMKKVGDVWERDLDAAFQSCKLLVDIRQQVQSEYNLSWDSWWHIEAQRKCENVLEKVWAKTKEGVHMNARSKKSKFNVYQFQEFGGHAWVQLFWGFGKVDEDHISFLSDAHWAAVSRKSNFPPRAKAEAHPEPRISTAGAKPPSDKLPEAYARKISERTWHNELLERVRAERIAFSWHLPSDLWRTESDLGRTGGKCGKGHSKGNNIWQLPSWLMDGVAMTVDEMDEFRRRSCSRSTMS